MTTPDLAELALMTLLSGLAAYGLQDLLVERMGPLALIARFRVAIGAQGRPDGSWRAPVPIIGEMLQCGYCAGFWLILPPLWVLILLPDAALVVVLFAAYGLVAGAQASVEAIATRARWSDAERAIQPAILSGTQPFDMRWSGAATNLHEELQALWHTTQAQGERIRHIQAVLAGWEPLYGWFDQEEWKRIAIERIKGWDTQPSTPPEALGSIDQEFPR